jgi:hypothetical protein
MSTFYFIMCFYEENRIESIEAKNVYNMGGLIPNLLKKMQLLVKAVSSLLFSLISSKSVPNSNLDSKFQYITLVINVLGRKKKKRS